MFWSEAAGHDRRPVAAALCVIGATWLVGSGTVSWPAAGRWWVAATAAVLAGVGAAARRPIVVYAMLALVAVCLTQRALDGLDGLDGPEAVQAEVTLVSDPRMTPGGGVRSEARLEGRRVALVAYQSPAAALQNRLAGERVIVVGKLEPPSEHERRFPHRHLSGRLRVDVVVGWQPGHGVTGLANKLRRTLADGAASLSERHQSLLAGLILGDSRDHPADLTDAFRGAGLTHLLVVSGSNVALLLVLLAPLLSRMRLAPRLVVTLSALAGFALLTRGEPSVLRATAMAAIGAYSAAGGTPVSGLRRLSLAVTALLLIDPLLVTALGFRLSAAGAAGIILWAQPLAERLPGPRWLVLPTAVTLAAEVAVAPLLVATFGSVPLVSLPANLLAVPAAGPVKLWGLSAGLVAGLVGEPVAGILHLPSRVLLWWLDWVSSALSGLPVGELRAGHLLALATGWAVTAGAWCLPLPRMCRWARMVGLSAMVGTLVAAALAGPDARMADDGVVEIGPGMELWRGGAGVVIVIDGRATEEWLMDGLRREQVDRVDVLVVRTSANRVVTTATELRRRWPHMVVLAPPEVTESPGGSRLPGAVTPTDGREWWVGELRVVVEVRRDRLEPAIEVGAPAPVVRPATGDGRALR